MRHIGGLSVESWPNTLSVQRIKFCRMGDDALGTNFLESAICGISKVSTHGSLYVYVYIYIHIYIYIYNLKIIRYIINTMRTCNTIN